MAASALSYPGLESREAKDGSTIPAISESGEAEAGCITLAASKSRTGCTLPKERYSHNALPHCLGAVGSATPAMHCLTALGQWAVELLSSTATLPRGSGQCNSCNALPHCLGAVGSATPACTRGGGLHSQDPMEGKQPPLVSGWVSGRGGRAGMHRKGGEVHPPPPAGRPAYAEPLSHFRLRGVMPIQRGCEERIMIGIGMGNQSVSVGEDFCVGSQGPCVGQPIVPIGGWVFGRVAWWFCVAETGLYRAQSLAACPNPILVDTGSDMKKAFG